MGSWAVLEYHVVDVVVYQSAIDDMSEAMRVADGVLFVREFHLMRDRVHSFLADFNVENTLEKTMKLENTYKKRSNFVNFYRNWPNSPRILSKITHKLLCLLVAHFIASRLCTLSQRLENDPFLVEHALRLEIRQICSGESGVDLLKIVAFSQATAHFSSWNAENPEKLENFEESRRKFTIFIFFSNFLFLEIFYFKSADFWEFFGENRSYFYNFLRHLQLISIFESF